MSSLIPEAESTAPFAADGGPVGALVLHGFTGNPHSLRGLAVALADAGFTVELPLLPGHGTTVADLVPTTWEDWSTAAEDAYVKLAARCDAVVVVGLGLCWASARGDRALLSGVKLWGRRRPRRLREEHETLRKTSGTGGRNSRR